MSTRLELSDLPPKYQAQALAQLKQQKKKTKPTKAALQQSTFASNLEKHFYNTYILPLEITGKIKSVELQKRFILYPAEQFCNIKLPAAHYTPDFVITYTDNTVEVIEVKHKKIKQLQKDYIYRRRLFIEMYAKPNGWAFTEHITGE